VPVGGVGHAQDPRFGGARREAEIGPSGQGMVGGGQQVVGVVEESLLVEAGIGQGQAVGGGHGDGQVSPTGEHQVEAVGWLGFPYRHCQSGMRVA
jgi:hypothetical protein